MHAYFTCSEPTRAIGRRASIGGTWARLRSTEPPEDSLSTMTATFLHLSDPGLIALVARGDRDAFAELYDRYGKTAYALAYRVTRDAQLAEEVVQEAFLTVWRQASRFDGRRAKPSTWLLTITHHKAVDVVRREQLRRTEPAEGMEDAPDSTNVPHEAWLGLQHDQVREALAAAARSPARGDRALVLRGLQPVRARAPARAAARHDQVAHAHRAHTTARAARRARNHDGEPVEHRELQDLIPAHALDALETDDALLLEEHVATCDDVPPRARRAARDDRAARLRDGRRSSRRHTCARRSSTPSPPRPRRPQARPRRARARVPARRLRRHPRGRRDRARDRHRAAQPARRRAQLARRAGGHRLEPAATRQRGAAARGQRAGRRRAQRLQRQAGAGRPAAAPRRAAPTRRG